MARGAIPGHAARRVRKAVRVLYLESLLRAFWPFWTCVVLALAAGLSGLLPLLGGWGHLAALAALAGGLAATLALGLVRWTAPRISAAIARLDGGSPERPVAAIFDEIEIGAGDPFAEKVWRAHRVRALALAARARGWPELRGDLARRDPFALRLCAPLLLAAAAMHAGADWPARIAAAATPDLRGEAAPPPRVEAWLEPPSYTGAPPAYLSEEGGRVGTAEVPEGTIFSAIVQNATEPPVLRLQLPNGVGAIHESPFEPTAGGGYELSAELATDALLEIHSGEASLGAWGIRVVPDEPPVISFATPPQATRSGTVTFAYRIADDYGAARAVAAVSLAGVEAEQPTLVPIAPLVIPLARPVDRARESEEFMIRDLQAHPWAGAEVAIELRVEDDAGQLGRSEVVLFRLPSPAFDEPMAAAFVEQRRALATATVLEEAARARDILAAAMRHPADYFEDPVAYLTGRIAAGRLNAMVGGRIIEEEYKSVQDFLWRAARRLEDGELSDALDELRDAIRDLEDALARGESGAQISARMQQLREAVAAYLNALQQQLANEVPAEVSAGVDLGSDVIERMLGNLEDGARFGEREQARRMLTQLRFLFENLQAGAQAQPNPAMGALGEMLSEQVDLSDRTLVAGRSPDPQSGGAGGGESGGKGGGESGSVEGVGAVLNALAAEQDALRARLEALRRERFGVPGARSGDGAGGDEDSAGTRIGRAGERLDEAGAAMGEARDALASGDAEGALAEQSAAIRSLRAAAEELRGGEEGVAVGVLPSGGGGADPFGGMPGGGAAVGDLDVREQQGLKRARDLFHEIRRRSAERTRPTAEREYLRRLIDRF